MVPQLVVFPMVIPPVMAYGNKICLNLGTITEDKWCHYKKWRFSLPHFWVSHMDDDLG